MSEMQNLRKKHQELQEFVRRKEEEMKRVRSLFMDQVSAATKHAKPLPPKLRTREQPRISSYTPKGLEVMRKRPEGPRKYNLIKVLDMMK